MSSALLLNDSPEHAGVGRYAYSLWRAMKQIKAPVDMAVFNYGTPTRSLYGERIIQAPLRFPILNRTLNWFYGLPRAVPTGYGLYHGTNQHMAKALLATKGLRVLTMHDVIAMDPGEGHPAVRFFERDALRKLRDIDRIITISHHSKKEINRVLHVPIDKIDVTWLGVDNAAFKPGPKTVSRKALLLPQEKKIVLHIGGDEPRKNLYGALNAFALLKDRNSLFIHVGHASTQTRMIAQKLGIEKRVYFIERAPQEKLVHYYRAANVFLFPSLHEGFGLPVAEAMACATPVVTSNNTALGEIAGRSALTVNPHDFREIARALEASLYDEKISWRLSQAGLKRSAMFSWTECAKRTLDSYKKAGWQP
ncbi:MAG TPA: glycosyltransferase family 1 protein [Candidatus Norongarragalinales archaeon]|jgi:glycosyltransferase involved in cell wall biosynthesis|nr:glycosyltransferase family 1 protein [Candidatus Norongarragalinales archaeon]